MLKYTTFDAINNRLDGRLQVGGVTAALGGTAVQPELVLQVAEQIEARVDAVLRRRYLLPLLFVHPVLASVVEKGCVCELMGQYYAGQQPSENGGGDLAVCTQFYQEMRMLDSVALPGEELAVVDQNQQGFSWQRAYAAPRFLPNRTVEW